ncbi:hypothetical protein RQN30_11755 [Arcanobacterium hippocoleae]
MEGFILRLVFIGIGLVAGIIAYFGYGADGGKSRLEGLKDRTAPRGALPLPQMTPEFEQRYFRRIAHEKEGCLQVFLRHSHFHSRQNQHVYFWVYFPAHSGLPRNSEYGRPYQRVKNFGIFCSEICPRTQDVLN